MIYNYLKKSMPSISDTERTAIEAGNTWLEAGIMQGNISWYDWKTTYQNMLDEKEELFMKEKVFPLCEMINDYEINEAGEIPKDIWDYLKTNKFFSLIIPKKYGGLDFSAYANSTIVATIASVSPSVAVTVMVPNSLGPGELLHRYGTKEQQQYWLPNLATGVDVPCFGLTSVVAGSDAGSIKDTGTVITGSDGKLKILLDFEKRYITLAPVATVAGLAFKLKDPEKLIDGKTEDWGITCALIKTNQAGVDNTNRHRPQGMAFMNGPLFGKQVLVDLEEAVIGGKSMVGKGWKMLVECLSTGRGISLPAMAAANSQTALLTTAYYTRIRKQFGMEIGNFEGIKAPLADIAIKSYMVEALRQMTLAGIDEGLSPSVVTAITKLHSTELGRECINHAFDIHGGKAVMHGPSNYLAKTYQGVPVGITVEGANILTRNLMVFGQGSIRCHPFLVDEINALEKPDGKKEFNMLFKGHVFYVLNNLVQTMLNRQPFSLFSPRPRVTGVSELDSLCVEIEKLSTKLSVVTDFALMLLGGKLKRKEFLSARLGDVLSYLFIACSCVMMVTRHTSQTADQPLAAAAIKKCLYLAERSFDEFFKNYPNKAIGFMLKAAMFPIGLRRNDVTFDEMSHITNLLKDDDFLKKLTPVVYNSQHIKTLRKAVNENDHDAIMSILNVDYFPVNGEMEELQLVQNA